MAIPSCHRIHPAQGLRVQPLVLLGWTIALLLLVAFPAIACGPPQSYLYGAKLMVVPAIAIISGYGLPFVGIIVLESLILHKRENIPYMKAIGCTLGAQTFYLVTCFLMFSNWSGYPMPILGGVLSGIMCNSFIQRRGFWKNIPKFVLSLLLVLGFVGLDLINLALIAGLNPRQMQPLPSLYLYTSGILLIGFIAGFVMKTFALHNLLKLKTVTLPRTVMSMNVGSFALVTGTLLINYVLGNSLL